MRLIDLELALLDPWQDYRERLAREEDFLRAAEDDDEPAASGIPASEEAFRRWL